MEINLVDLKKVINHLLDHIIETREITSFELKNNFYWNIPSPDVYNVDIKPKELDIGSIHDEWEFLSDLLDNENQPVAYQLTELAPILRYIGDRLGDDLAKFGG